jgi:hypothetical protein
MIRSFQGLFGAASLGFSRFDQPVFGRSAGLEGCQQTLGCLSDIVYGCLEGSLVGLGGLPVAADLAHELQRGLLQLLLGGGWVKVEQWADVPAQNFLLRGQ